MRVFILAAAVALWGSPAAADEKLLDRLDRDYAGLLKKEKNPQPLRQAARLLEQATNSDRGWEYREALTILRRGRSKAAVPLLLKYMIKHDSAAATVPWWAVDEYAAAIAILTGKDPAAVPLKGQARRPAASSLERAERLVKNWWLPNRAMVTTDLAQMSDEQRRVVVRYLLAEVRGSLDFEHRPTNPSTANVQRFLASDLGAESRFSPHWSPKEELHPGLVPAILAIAGSVGPAGARSKDRSRDGDNRAIFYAAVPLLAALRADGAAPDLDRVACDRKQPAATRLLCLLAVYCAGEELPTGPLLAVLGDEHEAERRILATLCLTYTRDRKAAAAKLLELREDPNAQVRAAAALVLRASNPAGELPKSKKENQP